MIIMKFVFGLIIMTFAIFNTTSARPPTFKLECEHTMKQGRLFNGKESIKLTEYAKNIEKAVGYKLNQNQIKGLTMEIEKDDTNKNGRLELKEMIDLKLEKSYLLKMFEIVDKNQDGFFDLSEIRSFTLGIVGNSLNPWQRTLITENAMENQLKDFLGSDNQMDFEEYVNWQTKSKAKCFE